MSDMPLQVSTTGRLDLATSAMRPERQLSMFGNIMQLQRCVTFPEAHITGKDDVDLFNENERLSIFPLLSFAVW